MAVLDPYLTHDSSDPSEPTTQTASPSVLPFCTDDHRVSIHILYNGTSLLPLKNCPLPREDVNPHLIHVVSPLGGAENLGITRPHQLKTPITP